MKFIKRVSLICEKDKKILDIGAGESRYKKYFSHLKYISSDLCVGDLNWDYSHIDIKSTAYEIPLDDKSVDYILCTQVLEHLEYPDKFFKESSRLLKKGGYIFLTVPLIQPEHQVPYDFYRYTKYKLEKFAYENNFKLTFIEPHGGIFVMLDYMFWQFVIWKLLFIPSSGEIRKIVFYLAVPIRILSGTISLLFDFLFDRKKEATINYNCIYKKIK